MLCNTFPAAHDSLDFSQLAAVRAGAPGGPERFAILPELIAKEPLSPVVRAATRSG